MLATTKLALALSVGFLAASCSNAPGAEISSISANFDIKDADIDSLYTSLSSALKNDAGLLSRVKAAQSAAIEVTSGSDSLSVAIASVQKQAKATFGTTEAFLSSQHINLQSITKAEVKQALQASRLKADGDLGPFTGMPLADRLKVLAVSIKVGLYASKLQGASGLALDDTGPVVPPAFKTNWLIVRDSSNKAIQVVDFGANAKGCINSRDVFNRDQTPERNALCTDSHPESLKGLTTTKDANYVDPQNVPPATMLDAQLKAQAEAKDRKNAGTEEYN